MPQTREEILAGFSTELQLLLACIGHFQDEEPGAALTPFLDRPIDWTYLLALANRHGVAPLLRQVLSASPAGWAPEEVMAELQRSHFLTAARAMMLIEEQRKVLALLAEHEIPVIPYKGVFLAEQLYGDASLRPTEDIDLIVHPEDVMRAKDLLVERRGYAPDFKFHSAQQEQLYIEQLHHYGLAQAQSRIRVEIHWELAQKGYGFAVDWPGIWQRAEPIVWHDVPVRQLASEDLFVLLAIHGGKHQWQALRWLADEVALVRQTPNLDWALIDERARSWRCERAVQLVCSLMEVVLPAPREVIWMPTADVCRLATQIWAYADQPTEPSISGSDLLKLKIALPDRQQDRLRLASQWLFGLNFQDMATADSSKAAAYLYRPLRIVRKRGIGGAAAILQKTAQGLWR